MDFITVNIFLFSSKMGPDSHRYSSAISDDPDIPSRMHTIAYRNKANVTRLCLNSPRIVFADANGIIECRVLCAYSSVVFMIGTRDARPSRRHGVSPGQPLKTGQISKFHARDSLCYLWTWLVYRDIIGVSLRMGDDRYLQ
jgi:hypothetical protein